MSADAFTDRLRQLLCSPFALEGNFATHGSISQHSRQQQTNDAFSAKWLRS
jgi:hypothetical protein